MYDILVLQCGGVYPMDNKITTTQGLWLADLPTMTCRHTTNNIILHFIKEGESLNPEIKDIPKELLFAIVRKPSNISHLQELIEEGNAVFFRAYFDSKTENNKPPK
jgi:hypothetical protein